MKKLFLLLATIAFILASCNKDDDNYRPTLSAAYLKGTWIETDPAQNHQLNFNANVAILTSVSDASFQSYNFSVMNGKIFFAMPGSDFESMYRIEVVDNTTFKITSLYPHAACTTCPEVTSTFKKVAVAPF